MLPGLGADGPKFFVWVGDPYPLYDRVLETIRVMGGVGRDTKEDNGKVSGWVDRYVDRQQFI